MTTKVERASFEAPSWLDDRAFTPLEAWLDLLAMATGEGIVTVLPYQERWAWKGTEVADFFTTLQRRGHLRPHDKTHWCITFQSQADGHLQREFAAIWKIYPKKVAKQKGYHAYCATRKGRKGAKPVTARRLMKATVAYAIARKGESDEFTMHASTFFGTDNRWKEKPRTNSKPKGNSQWAKPTSRDLTKDIPPSGTAKSPGRKKRTPDQGAKPKPRPKNPRKKSPPKHDPLGSL